MSLSTIASVAITPFLPRDLARVLEVILPIQNDEFGVGPGLEAQPDLADIPAFYQTGSGGFWCAKIGSEVVGTIALKDIGQTQAALRKMFVKAGFRGAEHGVALSLLKRLLDHARAQGVKDIFLGTTAKFLAAHRFYEKHGFAEIDVSSLPETFPKMTVDSKFYSLKLV